MADARTGPRYTYTNDSSVAVDFTLTIPARWTAGSRGIGGIEFAASRIPASYEVRVDRTLRQVARVLESEWAAMELMLEHARRGTQITVYPDGAAATNRVCYAAEEWARSLWEGGILPEPGEFTGELTIATEWVSTSTTWAGVEFYG